MPGRRLIVPVDAGKAGGALGRIRQWKISVLIMLPPRPGQDGRGSVGSTGSAGSTSGGTASSARPRATLALGPALGNQPK